MLWPVESIVDGTWGSGAPPPEYVMHVLMHEFKQSPQQIRDEWSPYEIMFNYDFLCIKSANEADQIATARRKADRQRGA